MFNTWLISVIRYTYSMHVGYNQVICKYLMHAQIRFNDKNIFCKEIPNIITLWSLYLVNQLLPYFLLLLPASQCSNLCIIQSSTPSEPNIVYLNCLTQVCVKSFSEHVVLVHQEEKEKHLLPPKNYWKGQCKCYVYFICLALCTYWYKSLDAF